MNAKSLDALALVGAIMLSFVWVLPVRANAQAIPDGPPVETPTPQAVLPLQASDTAPPIQPAAANIPPTITVWYESLYKFGQLGNPQNQINILGNVSDSDGSVASLTYTLNNTSPVSLSIGPNSTRLANQGDFNANIPVTTLIKNGTNTVTFTATDNSGGQKAKSISFTYTNGITWAMPYTTNWAVAGSIHNQAQVVDGLWQLEANGVTPAQVGYDRLIAIGDINWTDYEVLVPITTHAFTGTSSDPGGVGLIARWQGHFQETTEQPPSGWTNLGAYGYYSNRNTALALRLDGASPVTQAFDFSLNITYLFKLRVESTSTGGKYSLKVWELGQPEPAWSSPQFANIVNKVDSATDLKSGSVLLVAHQVDATFGNVTICPLSGTSYPLNLSTTGNGTVNSNASYNCGEGVSLTAQADPGWKFDRWTGDLASTNPTIHFNMTRPYSLTAIFQPVNVPTNIRVFLPLLTK